MAFSVKKILQSSPGPSNLVQVGPSNPELSVRDRYYLCYEGFHILLTNPRLAIQDCQSLKRNSLEDGQKETETYALTWK